MPSKRILFLINKLEVGGAQKVFANDIHELKKKGHSVHMAYLFGGEKEEEAFKDKLEEIPRYFLHAKGIYDISRILRLKKYVKENNIEVIYSTLNESNIVARFVKVFHPKVRVIIREANVAGPKPVQFKLLDILFNFLVHRIVCVSQEVKDSLWYEKMYAHKFAVLMNSVHIPDIPKSFNGLTEPMRLLNVGGLTPKKGQKFLIQAVAGYVQENGKKITLDIYGGDYGKGNYKGYLNDLIQELGASEYIHIHDFVSQEELSEVYRNHDVFVLSSLHEGCPNVLLEAMAHGLPSISTRVSGSNEIIDSKNGILVDAGSVQGLQEGIRSIVERKDELKDMGRQAREKMKNEFGVDVHINKLENVLGVK